MSSSEDESFTSIMHRAEASAEVSDNPKSAYARIARESAQTINQDILHMELLISRLQGRVQELRVIRDAYTGAAARIEGDLG